MAARSADTARAEPQICCVDQLKMIRNRSFVDLWPLSVVIPKVAVY